MEEGKWEQSSQEGGNQEGRRETSGHGKGGEMAQLTEMGKSGWGACFHLRFELFIEYQCETILTGNGNEGVDPEWDFRAGHLNLEGTSSDKLLKSQAFTRK